MSKPLRKPAIQTRLFMSNSFDLSLGTLNCEPRLISVWEVTFCTTLNCEMFDLSLGNYVLYYTEL